MAGGEMGMRRGSTTDRLEPLLRRASDRRLVKVTAATGWGKSKLAIEWAAATGGTLVALPPGPVEPSTPLVVASGEARDQRSLEELLAAPQPGWLVIDDAHRLNPASRTLVAQFARLGRRQVFLAADVELPEFAEAHWVLELGAPHLRLSPAEVAEWVRRDLGDDSAYTRIMSVGQGWPAATRILVDALQDQRNDRRAAEVHALARPHGRLGRFFRQVLDAQPPATRRLLTFLALAAPVTEELFDDFAPDSAPTRASMVLLGLVTKDPESGQLAVASGMVELLRADEHLSAPENRGLVDDIVAFQTGNGDVAGALRTSTRAGAGEQVARLLREHGAGLIPAGHLRTVCDAAESLGPEHRGVIVERLHGLALAYRGRAAEALRCLEAMGVPEEGELSPGMALVAGKVHHFTGDAAAAVAAYSRATPDPDDPDHALLLGWQSGAHWLLGDVDEAKDLAIRAVASAEALGSDRALAVAHPALALVASKEGDRRANALHYQLGLEAAERAGDQLQRTRILNNLGSRHLEAGEYRQALDHLDQAISLAEEQDFAVMAALARCNRAEVMLRAGSIDVAIADAETSREGFARIDSPLESYAHCILGDARREQGRLVQARIAYDRALALAERSGDTQSKVHALLGLSRVLTHDDPEAASASVRRAMRADRGLHAVECELAEAWVRLSVGDTDAARRGCESAWAEARRRDNHAGLAEAATLEALLGDDPVPALREAAHLWREVGASINVLRVELGIARRAAPGSVEALSLQDQLAEAGCSPYGGTFVDRLVSGADDLPPLVIHALGSFSIQRRGRPVPHSQWRSGKARDLLKILIVFRDRRLQREEVGHLLWPDRPYSAVGNRLSVALSLLRSALGKDTDALVTEGGRIGLDIDRVDLDVVRFERAAREGLDAVRAGDPEAARQPLVLAERIYDGDLLEEDPFTPWIDDERNHLRNLYLSVAHSLAGIIDQEDPQAATLLWLRVLDKDPYDEHAHHEVLRLLISSKRHGEAIRRHQIYSTRMAELDLPAVPLADIRRMSLSPA